MKDQLTKDLSKHIDILKESFAPTKNIKITISDLVVIEAFFKGSILDDLFTENRIKTEYFNHRWNDSILHDLANSNLDMAIYNKKRTEKFIASRGIENLEVISDLCYSMGGITST